jgi:hypothetical protein
MQFREKERKEEAGITTQIRNPNLLSYGIIPRFSEFGHIPIAPRSGKNISATTYPKERDWASQRNACVLLSAKVASMSAAPLDAQRPQTPS